MKMHPEGKDKGDFCYVTLTEGVLKKKLEGEGDTNNLFVLFFYLSVSIYECVL